MKYRSLFVLVILLSTQFLNAQVVNIPEKAKMHFAKKYHAAMDVEYNLLLSVALNVMFSVPVQVLA